MTKTPQTNPPAGKESYESILVLDPELALSTQKKLFQKIREIIQGFSGKIHHIDTWGVRRLAGRNKKKLKQGLYFHFLFDGKKGLISELVRQIRIQESLIYHHFEKLNPRISPKDHLQAFRDLIEDSIKKEKERQAQIQQRKKAFLSKKPSSFPTEGRGSVSEM